MLVDNHVYCLRVAAQAYCNIVYVLMTFTTLYYTSNLQCHIDKYNSYKLFFSVTENVAKSFLGSLLLWEAERARRPKTSLQEECCFESCSFKEVYDHCDEHFDAGIYDRY